MVGDEGFWSALGMWVWVVCVVWCAVFATVGYLVGKSKGRSTLGGWLGFLLGPFGAIAVGLMEPTSDELARRARLASGVGLITPRDPSASERAINADVRQKLLAEAIRRDSSLANPADADDFRRLNDAIASIEREYRLRAELDSLRESQNAAAVAEQRAREAADLAALDAEQALAAEERLAREEEEIKARLVERELAAAQARKEAIEAERVRLAAMRPVPRWIHSHKALTAVIAATAALGICAGVLAFVIAPTPQVTGLSLGQARSVIVSRQMQVEILDDACSAAKAPESACEVTGQEPGAGYPWTGRVAIRVAPTSASVPNLNGMTYREATQLVAAANLRIHAVDLGFSEQVLLEGDGWTVSSQEPAEGTRLSAGFTIKVKVEAPLIRVPDTVGQTPELAQEAIAAAGFPWVTVEPASWDREIHYEETDSGWVEIDQGWKVRTTSPRPGELARASETVTIQLSR